MELLPFPWNLLPPKLKKINITEASKLFSQAALDELRRPDGTVDVLVGINMASLHPTVVDITGDLRLLKSRFGKGWVIDGRHPSIEKKRQRCYYECTST